MKHTTCYAVTLFEPSLNVFGQTIHVSKDVTKEAVEAFFTGARVREITLSEYESVMEAQEAVKAMKRNAALEKLTQEEKDLLGL